MLLRLYRVTDRFGVLLFKLLSSLADALSDAVQTAVRLSRGGLQGILRVIRQLLGVALTAVVLLISGVWSLLRGVLRLLSLGVLRVFGGARAVLRLLIQGTRGALAVGRSVSQRGAQLTRTAAQTTTRSFLKAAVPSMARPKVAQPVDVKLVEDPLKVQNRRLSLLVLGLGVTVVGVLLWATDPSRSLERPLVPEGGALLAANDTNAPAPTVDAGGLVLVATPVPVATQVPVALRAGGTIAYTVRERGQTDLWLMSVASRVPIRLTNDASDERDPAWSWDGTRLAYASRRDGNWEIYVYELLAQNTTRITYDLSFQGGPTWSPDGLWLAYESYQGQNLDIYAVPIDGSAAPIRITDHPAADFAPAWSPDGRKIAFVSWRDGNQDVYVFDLDTLETRNVTNTPTRNEESPAWSPDGRWLAFSALEQGSEKVFVQAVESGTPSVAVSFGRTPSWSPDGVSLLFAVDALDKSQTYLYAVPYGREESAPTQILSAAYGATQPRWSERTIPPQLLNSGGLPLGVEPLFEEQVTRYETGAPYRLGSILDVQAPRASLSDRVNDSFNALRAHVFRVSGVDYLAQLDDAWWDLERRPSPGEERRSWHMTGRAFAIQRSSLLGFPPRIELVREDIGIDTFWRVYLRVDENAQSGQLGEPLRRLPWDFLSATQGDVEAYNQGGRLRAQIPAGYYVDLTRIAEDYGWLRYPSGSDWRGNVASRNFWLFVKSEGLSWYDAMLEIYTSGEIINFAPTPSARGS